LNMIKHSTTTTNPPAAIFAPPAEGKDLRVTRIRENFGASAKPYPSAVPGNLRLATLAFVNARRIGG
jgi:hypothetical protein